MSKNVLWSDRIDNKKFKVGDKVRLLSTSGAHQDWYEEHGYIGQVFTVIPSELTTQSDGSPRIFNNNDWDYVADCPHRLGGTGIGVREHNLELVFDKQLNDEIRKAVEAEWAGCKLAPWADDELAQWREASMYAGLEYAGLDKIINNKENKEMNIVTYAKLNKDQRTLYKANIVDANGALTDSGRNVLLDMLANEPATQTKLAAMAKEFKKDQKED